jgi:hypothetical protein
MDGFLEHLAQLQERVSAIVDFDDEAERPGQLAAKAGLRAHHPVIIIPGGRGCGMCWARAVCDVRVACSKEGTRATVWAGC